MTYSSLDQAIQVAREYSKASGELVEVRQSGASHFVADLAGRNAGPLVGLYRNGMSVGK